MVGNDIRGALQSLGDWCVNGLTLLFKRDVSSGDIVNILAIVRPYLESQNDIKDQREEETHQNKRVLYLGGRGEQPGETTEDLCHDSEG